MVRDAVVADAADIARVHVETWQACYRGMIDDEYLDGLDVAKRADRWRTSLGDGSAPAHVVVAERDGHVVGFASCGPAPDGEASGQIFAIYVRPEHWDTGAGAALLEAATARLRDDGFDAAVLWVLDANARARRFYERHGWQADGATDLFFTRAGEGEGVPELRYRVALA